MVSRWGAVEDFLVWFWSVCCAAAKRPMTMDKETQAIERRVAFIRLTVSSGHGSIGLNPF
jgi:hypothetical protein